MKYLYRISLIFMILTITSALVLGGYFLYQTNKVKENDRETEKKDLTLETAVTGGITDCDTEYIVLEYDLVSGNSVPYVERIPAKYIGKTKEEMETLLSEEEKAHRHGQPLVGNDCVDLVRQGQLVQGLAPAEAHPHHVLDEAVAGVGDEGLPVAQGVGVLVVPGDGVHLPAGQIGRAQSELQSR